MTMELIHEQIEAIAKAGYEAYRERFPNTLTPWEETAVRIRAAWSASAVAILAAYEAGRLSLALRGWLAPPADVREAMERWAKKDYATGFSGSRKRNEDLALLADWAVKVVGE